MNEIYFISCEITYTLMVFIRPLIHQLTLWVRTLLRRGVHDTTLCDKVCHWLAAGWWFSPSTPVSSTNKTDRHDITEILLKVALNTINLNPTSICEFLTTLKLMLYKYMYQLIILTCFERDFWIPLCKLFQ